MKNFVSIVLILWLSTCSFWAYSQANISFAVREGWSINASVSGYSPTQPRPNYLRYDMVRDSECRISLVVNYTDNNGQSQTARHFVTLRPVQGTETNYFLTVNPNEWRQPVELHIANVMNLQNSSNPNNNNFNPNNNNFNPNNSQNNSMMDCRAHFKNGYFSPESWNSLLKTIKDNSFDNSRTNIAKSAIKRANVTSAQVLEVMNLFSFEGAKLDFAKFAFDYACDPQNYFIVNQGLQYESSKTDLNNYLDGK
ncbi:MAG: DUF4476 domain-containing protein [Cytophagales bacterium]|nr:MAG: DUF4476 domain-containing protein [Cytophagales bacterium]TAF60413.1 MAG: DUF4476 domain-containing protein [Cytophagales bacterium]